MKMYEIRVRQKDATRTCRVLRKYKIHFQERPGSSLFTILHDIYNAKTTALFELASIGVRAKLVYPV
mgnify:CR=1 FL=1